MVECEFDILQKKSESEEVLIDTWWNVNWIRIPSVAVKVGVLIDTWWNVNVCHFLYPPGCFWF